MLELHGTVIDGEERRYLPFRNHFPLSDVIDVCQLDAIRGRSVDQRESLRCSIHSIRFTERWFRADRTERRVGSEKI